MGGKVHEGGSAIFGCVLDLNSFGEEGRGERG